MAIGIGGGGGNTPATNQITIVKPQQTNDISGNICRWQSNRQPYIFKLQRKDAEFQSITDNGFAKALVTCSLSQWNNLSIAVGDTLTLINYAGTYNYTGKITQIITTAGVVKFVMDCPYIGITGAGYILAAYKENFSFKLTIYGWSETLQSVKEIGKIIVTPDSSGLSKVDVRSVVTYSMSKRNYFDFDKRNDIDFSGWLCFQVSVQNSYYNSKTKAIETPVTLADQTYYYAIDGAKYLLSKYGQNFADYELQVGYPAANSKFLSSFAEPTYFIGYPFSLSYIFPDSMTGLDATSEEDELDINSSIINHQNFNLNTGITKVGHTEQLLLSGTYNPLTTAVDVWIETGGVASNNYAAEGYYAAGYADDVTAAPVTAARASEKKRVRINSDCRKNPIYLMWKNSIGGWDYYLFDGLIEVNYTAKQAGTYSVYNEDISTAYAREMLLSANQNKRFAVGAAVDMNDFEGLKSIELSSAVYMLYDITQLPNNPQLAWLYVTISPKGFKTYTAANLIEVEITFDVPDYYNIPN